MINNPNVKSGLDEAWKASHTASRGFIEHGGWVTMNRRGVVSVFLKPMEAGDTSILTTHLGSPANYIRGVRTGRLVVIADFHTHDNALENPGEVGIAFARGIPGIWKSGDWVKGYGPLRGLFGRGLPKSCK